MKNVNYRNRLMLLASQSPNGVKALLEACAQMPAKDLHASLLFLFSCEGWELFIWQAQAKKFIYGPNPETVEPLEPQEYRTQPPRETLNQP